MSDGRYCDRCGVKPAQAAVPMWLCKAHLIIEGSRMCKDCLTELKAAA